MKNITFFLLVAVFSASYSNGQTLSVFQSYESAGVKVELPSNYDTDKTSQTIVEYKKSSETVWKAGFHMDRIAAQGQDQFRGSLFGLTEGTSYDVRVTLVDSVPIVNTSVLAVLTFSTLNSPSFAATSNVKWVSPGGSGTSYTQTNPGNIKTLLGSGTVTCGTTIMVEDGEYNEFNMGMNITTSCTEGTPIQIIAAPGAQPVFDGRYLGTINWTQNSNDPKLYSASLPTGTDFTNICSINGQLLYPYPTLTANILTANYNLTDLSFDADGFVRDASTIWIKTQAGLDPNTSNVIISRAFRWLTVYGNNFNPHLKISGITVKNYGKSNTSGTITYNGMAADFRLVNNVTFDNCTFIHNNADIRFDGSCNNLLIQNSRFVNNNGLYWHSMSKKSNVDIALIPTTRGRGKETGAVKIFETKGLVLRNNHFDGVNSGVVSAYETGFVEEVDVYKNTFENNYDAIECDGFWSNLRVWENELISPMAAFSIAQPKIGPRYFYRNVVHHLKGRKNVQDDPHFNDCQPSTHYWSAGIAIKTNSGPVAGDSANLYFINNTFHSADSLGFVFTLWDSEWKSIEFINNILYDETKHLGYFHDLANKPKFQMKWTNNDFYVNTAGQPFFVAKEINGQFNCQSLMDINMLSADLNAISGSTGFSFTDNISLNPDFVNIATGDFSLNNTSAMINQGIVVKGFYDYNGTAPDLGAKESGVTNSLEDLDQTKNLILYPNPTKGSFTILLHDSESNVEVEMYSISGQLIPINFERSGTLIHVKQQLPSGIYLVHVSKNGDSNFIKLVVK